MSTIVTDIPPDKVGENVQQLIDSGAIKIVCTRQADGNWTIDAS
jgi:hypothetical protein